MGIFLLFFQDQIMKASYTENQYVVNTADQQPRISKYNAFSMTSDRKSIVQSIKIPTQEVEYKQQKLLDDSPSNKSSTVHHRNLSHLQKDKQILIQKMIREEVLKQSKIKNRKMSLDTDQTCICTSDIYTKEGSHWKNREISQITNKKFDSIPFENVKKLKLLSQQPMMGCNIFRITIDDKQTRDFAVKHIDISTWFGSSLWAGLAVAGLGSFVKRDFEGQIEGHILKKSQFLGNWELRYMSISAKKGLFSCKKKDGPVTVQIKEAKQLWTRFQTIVHGETTYVIIKLWYMMFKYEFGIPISDCIRWGKAFSSLIK